MRFQRQRKTDVHDLAGTTPLKVNGGARALIVTDELRTMLVELLAQGAPLVWRGRGRQTLTSSPFLFPYNNDQLHDLRRRVGAVAPDAFPPGDWLHTLRHTLSFELNRSGASDEEVQKQLGHLSPQTTRDVYINLHARPVDAGPMARLQAARRAGVTAWGAPPGGGPPPDVPAAEKRTPPVAAGGVQERTESCPTVRKENHPCRTPSQSSSEPSSRPVPSTMRTDAPPTSLPSSPRRPRGRTPATSPSSAQRSLPRLGAVAVTTRPARAAARTPGKGRR
jgi:hypothetical protein